MTQFGRYLNLEEIGRGGFATVYKALDSKLNRNVALKVLHAGYGSDPNFVARFHQEAQTIASLNHPNIITIYDFGDEDRRLFIAMEFLANGDLQAWFNRKKVPLSVAEALTFLAPVANALDYAHEQGIVHRDIKPSNIMLQKIRDDLRVVITDFGLVKAMEGSIALTMTNQMLGSPEYMAPEQADPNRHNEVGPHSDLYAFGIVAYQLLAGRVPFPGQGNSTLYAQEYKPVPPPQDINKSLLPGTADILVKMLSKSPTDRYSTATAFVQALEEIGQISSQNQQNEASVAALYKKLLKAHKSKNWIEVITLAAQIEVFNPDYKNISFLKTEAQNQLRVNQTQISSTLVDLPETSQEAPSSMPKRRWDKYIKSRPNQHKNARPAWIKWATLSLIAIMILAGGYLLVSSSSHNTKAGDTWERPEDKMEMVYVPKTTFPLTTFRMGSNDGESNEQPVHRVNLDAFWIDKTEVTNGQYALCVADGTCEKPRFISGAQQPVVGVDWRNANDYCKWVKRRLPTEAEWEYAARGPKGNLFPWGNSSPSCELLNYDMCIGEPTIVDSNSPEGDSWVGVSNMAGNVSEWVNDWYDDDYYANSPSQNPIGPTVSLTKVMRGGSYEDNTFDVRSSNRFSRDHTHSSESLGFRCAADSN